jgi:hypothetical protein
MSALLTSHNESPVTPEKPRFQRADFLPSEVVTCVRHAGLLFIKQKEVLERVAEESQAADDQSASPKTSRSADSDPVIREFRLEDYDALRRIVGADEWRTLTPNIYQVIRAGERLLIRGTTGDPGGESDGKTQPWRAILTETKLPLVPARAQITEEACIKALQVIASFVGGSVSAKIYNTVQPKSFQSFPSARAIINLFGSWNEAKREAGLPYTAAPHSKRSARSA